MGASLTYTTETPVPDVARGEIDAVVASLQHEWWAEKICFIADPSGNGRLYGDTKLFLLGYKTPEGRFVEIDPEDDSLMAWRDASFIVKCLEQWSAAYGLRWLLSCAGDDVGTINEGALDAHGSRFLDTFLDIAQVAPEQRHERASELLAFHSAR